MLIPTVNTSEQTRACNIKSSIGRVLVHGHFRCNWHAIWLSDLELHVMPTAIHTYIYIYIYVIIIIIFFFYSTNTWRMEIPAPQTAETQGIIIGNNMFLIIEGL